MTESKKQAAMPMPTALNVRTQSRVLEISFDDGKDFILPFELLRVYSPSAEVRGHAPGQEVLQTGKRMVGMPAIEPVGNYAVKPIFSDSHDTGIYAWDYLYWLGSNQEELWQTYLTRLQMAGFADESGRDMAMDEVSGGGCGSH